MLEKYPNNVKLAFKHFPLRNHQLARPAAIAALAAGEQGKFWEYHDALFADYSKINEQLFITIATKLELDIDQFNKSRTNPKFQTAINRDLQEAASIGVRGTPTIFINGKLLRNRSLQGFESLIEQELKKKRKQSKSK